MGVHMIALPDGVRICAETFGDPRAPAIVLCQGASASMLWWDAAVCDLLADAGRFVIRYDQRDTGLSTKYPVGSPGYSHADLARDVLEVLDALGIERAHLAGCSMAGGIVLHLGLIAPERFASLTFISTSTGEPGLPAPEASFPETPSGLSELGAQIEFLLAQVRACDDVSPFYDDAAARALVQADAERSGDLRPALINHFLAELGHRDDASFADLTLPTLVLHGELDPVFPLPHGEALARAVPDARFVVLPAQGHDLLPHNWERFVRELVAHTSAP